MRGHAVASRCGRQYVAKLHLDRAVVPLRRVLRPSTMTRASATLDATASTRLPRGATATPIALLSDESRIQLFYRSSWEGARVHGSLKGAPWVDFPLKQSPTSPDRWMLANIPLQQQKEQNGDAPLFEFVVTDGTGWDKPPTGENYCAHEPGTYRLLRGVLSRLAPDAAPAVLLVSDLDGTMVGDDAATAEFRDWWEAEGVLRGGVLVYNTGRSLESFKQLLEDKANCLARPDVLISAVGTKVYNRCPKQGWQEDAGWTAQLDRGWRVSSVRDAAYAALAAVGKDAMHFRPPEEQNDHKVTCGVRADVLDAVATGIRRDLDAANVQANVIISGEGDWRFVDLVPARAGKLQALEHVRAAHGFQLAATVACGDSGNDILMLSGANLAIVVGNAQPDLIKWLDGAGAASAGEGNSPLPGKVRLHRAGAAEARGILEGLSYFGFMT